MKVSDIERVRALSEFNDPGESEAIALSQEINADLLILDEKIGSLRAIATGLNITGMIGSFLSQRKKTY